MGRKGFSTVETILVLAITGLLAILLVGIVVTINKAIRERLATADLLASNRNALERIAAEIRESSSVLSSHTTNGTAYTTSRTVLVLSLPSLDANKIPIPGSSDYVAFAPSATNATLLTRDAEIAASSSRIGGQTTVARFVESIRFLYNEPNPQDASRIEVFLQTSQTKYGNTQSVAATIAATLRNK